MLSQLTRPFLLHARLADQVLGKQVAPEKPDFNKIEVVDFFRRLGPSAVFNANIILGPPHDIIMTESDEGFGFVIRGNRPVKVRSVDRDSPADVSTHCKWRAQ
jgi:hypothetical protein